MISARLGRCVWQDRSGARGLFEDVWKAEGENSFETRLTRKRDTQADCCATFSVLVPQCNMYSLHNLGPQLEVLSGGPRFTAIYLTSAAVSCVASYLFCKAPSLGASGRSQAGYSGEIWARMF